MRYWIFIILGCIFALSLWGADTHFLEKQKVPLLSKEIANKDIHIEIEQEQTIGDFSLLPKELIMAIIIFSPDWDQWSRFNHYFHKITRELIPGNFDLKFATSLTCSDYLIKLELLLLKFQENQELIEQFPPRFIQQAKQLICLLDRMPYAPTLACNETATRVDAIKKALSIADNPSSSWPQNFLRDVNKFTTSVFRDPALLSVLTIVVGYSAYSLFYGSPLWWSNFQVSLAENFKAALNESESYLNSTASHDEIARNFWNYARWWVDIDKSGALENATCIETYVEMWSKVHHKFSDYCAVRDVLEIKGGLRQLWANSTDQILQAQKILNNAFIPPINIPVDYLFNAQNSILEAYEKSGFEASSSLADIKYYHFNAVDMLVGLSNDTHRNLVVSQLVLIKGRAINGGFEQCQNANNSIVANPIREIMAYWARAALRVNLHCLAEQKNAHMLTVSPNFYVPIIFNSIYFIFYFCGLYMAFSM